LKDLVLSYLGEFRVEVTALAEEIHGEEKVTATKFDKTCEAG
jgi:hypothetical protein